MQPLTSIAQVVRYVDEHTEHFGFAPAAVLGSAELQAEADAIIASFSPKPNIRFTSDTLYGVHVIWPPDEDEEG